MSRMLKSSGAVGAATLLSRVLGYVREWAYAWFLGVGPVTDAFVTAFTIPNLFRRLLGEGALTTAFVPIFASMDREGREKEMWRATNAVLCAVGLACVVLTLVVIAGITGILGVVKLDFRHELVLRLMRWMFPYLVLVCLAAVLIGVLNARGSYFLPALGATMLNLVMISSVLFLGFGYGNPWFGGRIETQVFGLAVSILLAGLAQALFQLPGLWRAGFRPAWVAPWQNETVREVVRRMGPATVGAAAFQLNVTITQVLAQSHAASVTSAFNYAVRLMELPQGVLGISLATFLLTELSRLAAAKQFPEFRSTLLEGVGNLVFLNTFAAAMAWALAEPIVRLLFEYGQFRSSATPMVAAALRMLAPGLVAYSLNNILARAFYALGDTGTPMRISVACLGLNLVFVLFLLPLFHQAGLGLANSLSASLNTGLLLYGLKRAFPKLALTTLLPTVAVSVAAAVVTAVGAWYSAVAIEGWLGNEGVPARAAVVFGPMLGAGLVYFGAGLGARLSPALEMLRLVLPRQKG